MTADSIFQEIKEALNGRPGQAIVLGVCQALATRFHREVWQVRLCTIVLAIIWTVPITAIYILLGFMMPESENRTRGFFRGLGIVARETADKATAFFGRYFGSGQESGNHRQSY